VIDPAAFVGNKWTYSGDTSLAGESSHHAVAPGECPGIAVGGGDGDGNDDAFSLTPKTDGKYSFTLTTPVFKCLLYVVTDCKMIGSTCLDGAEGTGLGFTLALKAGTTYYIVVDGLHAVDNGPYELDVVSE
jgi:hypothetical protein